MGKTYDKSLGLQRLSVILSQIGRVKFEKVLLRSMSILLDNSVSLQNLQENLDLFK